MIEEELANFTDAQNWDALCHYAQMRGIPASLSEEQEDGSIVLVARTADPALNPGAVAVTESSSPFRKMLHNATIRTLQQLAHHSTETPDVKT